MKLIDANKNDVLIILSIDAIKPAYRNAIRDIGLHEGSIINIDEIGDAYIIFHSDSDKMTVSKNDAKNIDVKRYIASI